MANNNMTADQFITHWKDNDLNEKAGAQQHFNDLCDLLDVEKPRDRENYCFERGAKKSDGSDGLNPMEWVDWVITPEEEKAGYPKRPVAKAGKADDLKKRTLTNLYNARPAWLDMAHKALDKAVAAAYGWSDYTLEMPDETILGRLLVLNLERAKETL